MSESESHSVNCPPASAGGRATLHGWIIGVVGGAVVGVLWAWWGEVAQTFFAPFLLFPLLIGAGVGVTMVGVARVTQSGNHATIVAGVVLAACLAAVGQHYVLYLDLYYWHRPAVTGEAGQAVLQAAVRDLIPSFGQYLQSQVDRGRPLLPDYRIEGWAVWFSWVIDGILTMAAAVAVTLPAMRTPYCDRCRSWYRVTRNGKIDLPTAERLAEMAGVVLPERTRSRRYRFSDCRSGCSPTCCELSWEDMAGRVSLVQFWLDAAGRAQMATVLNQVASETDDDEEA